MPGNGNTTISDFLIQLAKEPGLAKKFKDHPKKTVDDAQLSADAVKVLKTGDVEQIRAAVEAEQPGSTVALIVFPINLP
jgi:hypothetical protein